jgi:alpha-L-rhamnosidase
MPEVEIVDLRCEYMTTPLGIGAAKPRLGWKLRSERRGVRQTAYRVLAGTAEGLADLWDSGRVDSDQSIHIPYAGKELTSRRRVWWRVQVWDETGAEWASESTWWEMGLLHRGNWTASWIGSDVVGGPAECAPAPYVRHETTIDWPIVSARLYVTALGLYEFYINGQRVGLDHLTPGWTEYRRRVQYQVYDIAPLLTQGANAFGAILGDGWYCGHVGWNERGFYGDRPLLLAQVEVTFEDGSRQVIVTDGSWKTATGPLLCGDLLMGETYDARKELGPWAIPGYDCSAWKAARRFPDPEIALAAMQGPPVRVTQEISPVAPPVKIAGESGAAWIYDLGQNMVGWARIKAAGPRGAAVRLRFAEILDTDGTLYTENLRSAKSTDTYILKGNGEEEWEPRFTFHGFRYVEVSGLPEPPIAITGIVAHSDTPWAGSFACSDPLVTQLQKNITWGQRGNFLEVPTDCPQRNERLGWTGDAQVFIRTAAFNMNVAPFFHKWLQDMRDSQLPSGAIPSVVPDAISKGLEEGEDGGPAWSDAAVICPWTIYLCYGDRRILEENYEMMSRYVKFLEASSVDLIRSHPDLSGHLGYGDWLSINADTAQDLIGTAFFAYSAGLLAKAAAVIGKEDDQKAFAGLAERVKQAFRRRFVTEGGLLVTPTQTACLLALHFDLLPEDRRESVLKTLVQDIKRRGNKLSTGFVGSPYLNLALSRFGRNDVAYALLAQKEWPSWLYAVTQGATTIWERWDGWTHDKGFQEAGMNSFNHYAYGAIGAWLYGTVAGIEIDPEKPGYKHAILKPQPGGALTSAEASLETEYGRLASAWTLADGRFTWKVTVPANTTATAYVPTSDPAAIRESGQPAGESAGIRAHDAASAVFELQPGVYAFEAPLAVNP